MKKIYGKRIIALTITFLIIISFTSLGYKLGFDNRIYASEQIIQQQAAKLAPVVAWLALNYDKAEQTVENLSGYIDSAKQTFNKAYQSLSATSKVINAMVFTDYSLEEINAVYGTSYSESKVTSFGINELRLKIANGEPLTEYDMHLLGIDKLLAEEIKDNQAANKISNGSIIEENGKIAHAMTISGKDYWVKPFNSNDVIFDSMPFQFKVTQSINAQLGASWRNYILVNTTTYINSNEKYFKIEMSYLYSKPSLSTAALSTAKVLGTYSADSGDSGGAKGIILYKLVGNTWEEIYKNTAFSVANTGLFNKLSEETGVNLSTHQRYGEVIWSSIPNNWVGNNISFGDPSLLYTVFTPTADIFGEVGASDNNIEDAEAIIGNIAAQGADTNEIEIDVSGYENADTGEPEIVVIPTGTAGVDTGSPVQDIPDTSGDTNTNEDGTGSMNIPILGTLLSWLKKIWQMLKDIYDIILNYFMNPTSTDSGTDWGNFKNFFDIFWIFYYLIILAIIMLLKFFGVILSILNIPANTALFNQYPTMLSGLNYIKNIKVGGFDVTLQTIFEYMFTVFFFLYIATTLQKLYHSFQGIERQQIRANEKEARIERYSSESHYQPNNFNAGINYASSHEPDKNKFLDNVRAPGLNDNDYENIKFTGWGD